MSRIDEVINNFVHIHKDCFFSGKRDVTIQELNNTFRSALSPSFHPEGTLTGLVDIK